MSTNNFKFENILVVVPDFRFDNRCMDEECPHFEEEGVHCEHVDTYYEYDIEGYKMWKEDVQEQLEKIGFSSCDRTDSDRNYSGDIIACFTFYDKHDYFKEIQVVIRNGYYDGMNIDYIVSDDGCYEETKTMKKQVDAKIKKLEKILRKNGTEMLKVGQFSNGEAVYKRKK